VVKTLNHVGSMVSHISHSKETACWFMSEVIYDRTTLKCLPIFRSFVKAAKHIHQTELRTMVCVDFFK